MVDRYNSYEEMDESTVTYLLLLSGAKDIQELNLADINAYFEGLYAFDRYMNETEQAA